MSDFLSAARFTDKSNRLPHQDAAWRWAWELLNEDERKQFLEMFRAAPEPKEPLPAPWLAPALQIIKAWEGCRLEAYRCSAGVPTIGYGATRMIDGPVRMGDKITQEMAEELLENQVVNLFAPGLFSLLPMMKKWKPNQQAALISWAFNIGLGAAEESTLCKRILASEDPTKVVIEELPRWNKADGKVLEGLVRRRRAEVDLFTGSTQAAIKDETTVSPVKVTPSSPFATRLTAHVQLGEFALWQEERRFVHQYQVDTAAELAAFLERVRVAFGNKAIIITSGFRPPAVNKSVGGASSSEHLFDAPGVGAVDFYVKDADIKAVENWCDKNWPFSVGYGAVKGFCHVGIRKGRPRVRWDY